MIVGLPPEAYFAFCARYWYWYLMGYNQPTMNFLHEYRKLIAKGHEILDRFENVRNDKTGVG